MGAHGTPKPDANSAGRHQPLVDAMMRPGFYPDSPARVELKQTHISYVFVAGDFVYKVKKPVHFPFLDCSNLADRFRYCREEVRLNARLSPGVYLGVFAIPYGAMLAEAASLLSEGCGAILDATFKTSADKQLAIALASRHGVPVLFVECIVGQDEAIRRLNERASKAGEVSDATPKVYKKQRDEFEPIREIPARNYLRIDTTRPREHLVVEIEDALERLL